MDVTSWVIATFTIVIAISTGIYTWVTWRLLKQSRNAFLADVVFRMLRKHDEIAKTSRDSKKSSAEIMFYYTDLTDMLEYISKDLAKTFREIIAHKARKAEIREEGW